MKDLLVTIKLLKQLDACKDIIKFIELNKLEGFPFNRLDEIKGDYIGYIQWIRSFEKIQFDEKGNLTYSKNSNDYEKRYKYDEKGNLTNFKHSRKLDFFYEKWLEIFDERGNMIHNKDSRGNEERYIVEYYENGQLKRINDLIIPFVNIG